MNLHGQSLNSSSHPPRPQTDSYQSSHHSKPTPPKFKMKTTPAAVAFTYLAGFAAAAPIAQPQGFFGGIGGGDNFFSGVFDSAACIVSSFIGGGNPRCKGQGTATLPVSVGDNNNNNNSNRYSFKYDTNNDGSLKVTINLARGGSCTYDIKADGEDLKSAVGKAAKRCLDEN
ncbi:hypothetical protein CC79DRAFT_1338683 [Sarocladium strictum]